MIMQARLSDILAALLAAQIAIFAVVALLRAGGLRRFLLERRVSSHLAATSEPVVAAAVRRIEYSRFVRLCLWDLPDGQRVAIPWLGAMYRLGPTASLVAFAWIRVAALTLGVAVPMYLFSFVFDETQFGIPAMVLGAFTLSGMNWWMTRRYAAGLARARQETISRGMPYALDLILICLDSGVALEASILRVGAELSVRDPLVAEELQRTLLDINVLGSREQAFRNLGERIDTANMRSIVTVLCQSLQYGSSLAVSLKEAIQNMKRVELLDLEERAGKLPVQLTLPGMVFTLPQVIILLAGPGVVSLLETFKPV